MTRTLLLLAALPVITSAFTARAQQITETFDFTGLNLAVPDGDPSGLASTRFINSAIASIDSVRLTLNVSGSFNGDLYAYLTNGDGFSVLLNRAGATAAEGFGYDDDGFSVTFDDTAPGDIHTYRDAVTPAPGSPLTGLWQPDGRAADPALVTEFSARTAMLGSFTGGAGAGDWTLYIADLGGGDTHVLESWSLSFTGAAIPEPSGVLLALMTGVLIAASRRRM